MIYQRGFLARPLDALFSNGTRVAVLRALFKSRQPISGRAAARDAGVNHQAAANALSALEELGIAKRSGTGRDILWSLDRRRWVVSEFIEHVFEIEENYAVCVAQAIREPLKPLCAGLLLLGAAARGKLEPGGTLVFAAVVGKAGRAPLAKAVRQVVEELWSLWGLKAEARVVTSEEAGNLAILDEAWRLYPGPEGRGWREH